MDLSEEDFHILSGGQVMIPSGATSDDLTTEDTESDGQISRTYSFGGTQVGTAVIENTAEDATTADNQENDTNMEAARVSQNASPVPYFIIGGVGVLLLVLLLWRLIRIIKS